MLEKIARVLVVIVMSVLASVHYNAGQYLLFAGDCAIALIITANWAYPFIVAKMKGDKR